MKSAKPQGDIIKNVTPGNPNAMIRQQQGNRIGVDLDRPGVNVLRGDMDEMRKMTRALDEIRVQLGFLHWHDISPRWIYNWQIDN